MRIKKGDTVVVITGKDKGKTGTVLKAMPKENKVVVEGVNMQTKHARFLVTNRSSYFLSFDLSNIKEIKFTVPSANFWT